MVKLSYDIEFSSIIINERRIFPNIFDLQINVNTLTEDSYEQNVAFRRILFFIQEIIDRSIFIYEKNPIFPALKETLKNNHFVVLPEEPYDQIIGFMLYNKLSAITEERFELDSLIISSKDSNNIMYTIDDLNIFDGEEDSEIENWWNLSELTSTNDEKEIESNIDWEDVDLGWEYIEEGECNCEDDEPEVVFAPEKKNNSIFILEGGKSSKEPKDEK